jgi:hypothetical protein
MAKSFHFFPEGGAEMAKKKMTFDDIMEMAEQYGVKENILFVSAADRYAAQIKMISDMQESLNTDGLVIKTTGSMGQEKIDANPLVAQLPKYNDTANKTLGVMLDIIQRLGTAAPAGDKLGEFLSE